MELQLKLLLLWKLQYRLLGKNLRNMQKYKANLQKEKLEHEENEGI